MSNFDLKVIPATKKAVVFCQSDFGESTTEIEYHFLNEMTLTSKELRASFEENRDSPELVNNFGLRLFRGIFKDRVLDLFNRTVGGSESGQIDIRLMLGDARLNTIHWELMRYGNEFLGFKHNLIRHPFVSRPTTTPKKRHNKLHVLAVAVDQKGVSSIYKEHKVLCELLKSFGDQIKLTTLKHSEATLDNIIDSLFEGVDIWHFAGHGAFDAHNPMDSFLAVWSDRENEFDRLSVRAIRTISMSHNLGFAFLNACDTGKTADSKNEQAKSTESDQPETISEFFVNMAHSLIEVGVPMVVATNHMINDRAATRFSKRFYTSIIKFGQRVDQAVREGRAELYITPGIPQSSWSCPILYARSNYMGLGIEDLERQELFDLYKIQNVERPQ